MVDASARTDEAQYRCCGWKQIRSWCGNITRLFRHMYWRPLFLTAIMHSMHHGNASIIFRLVIFSASLSLSYLGDGLSIVLHSIYQRGATSDSTHLWLLRSLQVKTQFAVQRAYRESNMAAYYLAQYGLMLPKMGYYTQHTLPLLIRSCVILDRTIWNVRNA